MLHYSMTTRDKMHPFLDREDSVNRKTTGREAPSPDCGRQREDEGCTVES